MSVAMPGPPFWPDRASAVLFSLDSCYACCSRRCGEAAGRTSGAITLSLIDMASDGEPVVPTGEEPMGGGDVLNNNAETETHTADVGELVIVEAAGSPRGARRTVAIAPPAAGTRVPCCQPPLRWSVSIAAWGCSSAGTLPVLGGTTLTARPAASPPSPSLARLQRPRRPSPQRPRPPPSLRSLP